MNCFYRLGIAFFSMSGIVWALHPSSLEPSTRLATHLQDNHLLTSDCNGNGRREFLISRRMDGPSSPNDFLFYEEDGGGGFHLVNELRAGVGANPVAIGDVDGDGNADLFFFRFTPSGTRQLVRCESAGPNSFPSVETVIEDARGGAYTPSEGVLADADGDGRKELIVTESTPDNASNLVVYEATFDGGLRRVWSAFLADGQGNPVVADFDGDGKREILVQAWTYIHVFECVGDNQFAPTQNIPNQTGADANFGPIAVVDLGAPGGTPFLLSTGSVSSGMRLSVYQSQGNNNLVLVNRVGLPFSGISNVQMKVADLLGDATPEIVLARLAGPIPIYSIGPGGALQLTDLPMLHSSLSLAAMPKDSSRPAAIAVGTLPNASNPMGATVVFQ